MILIFLPMLRKVPGVIRSMGSLFSIPLPAESLMKACCTCLQTQVNYAVELEENVNKLKILWDELKELRNDVRRKIEFPGERRPLDQVQGWLSRVEAMETEVNNLIASSDREINRRCCFDFCHKNCYVTRKLGKQVTKMLERVADLKGKGDFNEFVGSLPSSNVEEIQSEPAVGIESIFEKAWNHLQEEDVGIMGLYGLGGVGKTTLLKKINNEFANKSHDFEVVIWAVVSKDADMTTVQKKIAEKIGICDENWMSKSIDDKAIDIHRVLSKKKFVLLLDDVWKRFDLPRIGVPIPTKRNKSKIVFTTRSQNVCGRMDAQKKIKVECLSQVEAWNLFREKVGEETLGSDQRIYEIAQDVARECDGLPLALITIGRAMACRSTFQEWQHALQVLKRSAAEFSGMRDDVFPLLHFSYASLPSDAVKDCFLYCCLFPEDFAINKEELIDYLIGEGILNHSIEARNQGYDIIGTLVHVCMMEELSPKAIKMHDVMRDMALWIAREYGNAKNKFWVQTGMNLQQIGPNENSGISEWEAVERKSLSGSNIRELKGSPTCPKLATLLLHGNDIRSIGVFCCFMPYLNVLDLSYNFNIKTFPLEICELISLQYLNLTKVGIPELPIQLKRLVNLKVLNLTFTKELCHIPPKVISCLSSLQVFRMVSSRLDVDGTLIEDLDCLKHLNFLTISIRGAYTFQILSRSPKLLSCMRKLELTSVRDVTSLHVPPPDSMKNLGSLRLICCDTLEEVVIDWEVQRNHAQTTYPRTTNVGGYHFFYSLDFVRISECPRLKNLAWLVFAPSITAITIHSCSEMEEVLCSGTCTEITEPARNSNSIFGKLKQLQLHGVPKLKSIYPGSLPLPCLRVVIVLGCKKLKKLPLDSNSAKGCGIQIKGSREWFNDLIWEDEATRNTFLPSFVPFNNWQIVI